MEHARSDGPVSPPVLARASLAAGLLLATLCTMTLASGVSQQWFEWARPPEVYGAALARDAGWLRAIITVDDLFIAAYVTATVLFARWLARGRMELIHFLVVGCVLVAGVIDLEENHHILSMVGLSRDGVSIPLDDVLHRARLSPLKWMLGHLAFVLAGVAVAGRDRLTRLFRASLIAVQLPIGALVWTVDDPVWATALVWARYVSFIAGFVTIAILSGSRGRARAAVDAAGSGAPA